MNWRPATAFNNSPALPSLERLIRANGRYGLYLIATFLTHAGRKRARLSTYTVGGTFTGNRSFSSSAAARRYVDTIEITPSKGGTDNRWSFSDV
jgi:hypothetical protein